MHQVRQIVGPNARRADNAPEGIHRDGADWIISALVVQRVGVLGGESVVYDPARRRLFRARLRAGEGLLQDDRQLWHDVSQIRLAPRHARGVRDLFGLDLFWIPCES